MQKEIKNINTFWRVAPKKLKEFVKYQILENGYITDPTGSAIKAHVWECLSIDLSIECCRDLVEHYRIVKENKCSQND